MSRPRRILLRLLLVFVLLGVVGLVLFTVFFHWPLEGRVDDMAGLVPGDVDFVYRGSWSGIRDTGWLQENVLEHPIVPQIEDQLAALRDGLQALEDGEEQINDQIPGDVVTFSFAGDVFPSETIFAGRFCESWGPERGVPRHWEFVALTRVSWKLRFASALKHEWARKMFLPDFEITDRGEGVYKVVISPTIVRPTPVRARSGCAPGVVIPPENVWFLRRVKDVIALASTESILRDVAYLEEYPDSGRSYLSRPWVRLDAPPNAVAASLDLHPLESYLVRFLEMRGSPVTILQRYLTLTALDRMNGTLALPSRDLAQVEAEIRYQPSQLADGIQEVYGLRPARLASSVAALLPAEDTFGALLLRTSPLHLIEAIFGEILQDSDRKLWEDNLRRMGKEQDIHQFFAEFAGKLSDTAAIAVARVSDVFDGIDYTDFYTDTDMPDPNWPALAIMVRLKTGVLPSELDEYLAERVPLLGASSELEQVEYRGLTYTRITQEMEIADYALMTPAYILAQDHFLFSSNEAYFRKILDTMADPKAHPSLAADPTFRSTVQRLDEETHLTFFLDLGKLFTVPPHRGVGAQPRGFLWDQRNLWVLKNRHPRTESIRFREQLKKEHVTRTGRPPTVQEEQAIEDRVTERWNAWKSRYPAFEEEYREHLSRFGRLRAFGASIRAKRPSLMVRSALLLERPARATTDDAMVER